MFSNAKTLVLSLFILCFLLFSACKSKFERIRESNNISLKYKEALRLYNKKDYASAIILFEDLNTQFRGRAEAEEVAYYYAYSQYHYKDFLTARELFRTFYATYPESSKAEESLYMAAYCTYKESPRSSLDQQFTYKAIEAFQLFINVYPNSKKLADASKLIQQMREKLETKAFTNARQYFYVGNYKAGVIAFKNCTRDFPDTKYEEEIIYLTIKSQFLYAKNSIDAKKEDRFNEMEVYAQEFFDKYPTSKYVKDIEQMQKESLQIILKTKNVITQHLIK